MRCASVRQRKPASPADKQKELEKEYAEQKIPEKIIIPSPPVCKGGEWKNDKCVKDNDKPIIIKKTKKSIKMIMITTMIMTLTT